VIDSGSERQKSMSRFKAYCPDQEYLLPPSVRDELGKDHLCFFVPGGWSGVWIERSYSEEGGELYAPELLLSIWLNAYALGITSATT
jgi:hypothetical protein